MPAVTATDLVNRALQHLGATRIGNITDNSKNAAEANFVYDKVRRAELRTNLWSSTARRCILRPYIPGVSLMWFVPGWTSSPTYAAGNIVSVGDVIWMSTINSNVNNAPGTGTPFQFWNEFQAPLMINPYVAGTTYYPGEVTTLNAASQLYVATAPTTAQPPASPWVPTGVQNGISGAVVFAPFFPTSPPFTTSSLATPKIAYSLPSSYIRVMPQDPKSVSTPAQLTTAGMQNADFEFEGNFLYTSQPGPIVFRYTADLEMPQWYDVLLREAISASLARELCETLTQSAQKAQIVNALYGEIIAKAVRVNAIEAGSTEPDTDKVDSQRGPTREKLPPQQRQQ